MNTTELRKPLIQTVAILAGLIFLISLAGGSESTSFFGMIETIIGGIFSIIKLGIGLPLAFAFAIACLIGVFFAAVALYSVEDCKKIYGQFRQNLTRVKNDLLNRECSSHVCSDLPNKTPVQSTAVSEVEDAIREEISAPVESEESIAIKALEEKMVSSLEGQQNKEKELENSIATLSQQLETKAEVAINEQVTGLISAQEETSNTISTTTSRVESLEAVIKEQATEASKLNQTIADLQKQLDASKTEDLNKKVEELHNQLKSAEDSSELDSKIEELQKKLEAASDTSDLTAKIDELQKKLEAADKGDLNKQVQELQAKIDNADDDKLSTKVVELEKKLDDANNEILQLQNLFTAPPEEAPKKKKTNIAPKSDDKLDTKHRIFSYLEDSKDQKLFAEKVQEAVNNDMTYAEIDEFLTASLSKKTDTIIKDHPSLTKDYVRHTKKQS
jgi:chromosome segregation ATPase